MFGTCAYIIFFLCLLIIHRYCFEIKNERGREKVVYQKSESGVTRITKSCATKLDSGDVEKERESEKTLS